MNKTHETFKKLLQNILLHLKLENKCVIPPDNNDNILTDVYSPGSFFIEVEDQHCFVFNGDLNYLMSKLSYLLKNSSTTFGNLTQDKRIFIEQSIERIIDCIKEQEMVRFWTMKLSTEFMNIFNKYNSKLKPSCTNDEVQIIELEADSWITQIRNFVSCKKTGNKKCLYEEMQFWYHFKENLKILESFYHSNQYVFLYRITLDYNLLILRSTFDSYKDLKKYYNLCNLFLDYLRRIDLDFLYYSTNLKSFAEGHKKAVNYILNTFRRQPKALKNSIIHNSNSLFKESLGQLRHAILENDINVILCILQSSKNLYKELFKEKQQNTEDADLVDYIRSITHYDMIVSQYLRTIEVTELIKTLSTVPLPINECLSGLKQKSSEYCNYIISKFKDNGNEETSVEVIKFEEYCVDLIVDCFKEGWKAENETFTSLLEYKKNSKIMPEIKIFSTPFINSSLTVTEENRMSKWLRILNLFKPFVDSPVLRRETIVERSKILDFFDRQLLNIIDNSQKEEKEILKTVVLYIGFITNLNEVLETYFKNTTNLIILETIKQKMNIAEEILHAKLNCIFENIDNLLSKTNLNEVILITMGTIYEGSIQNSINVVDLTKEYKIIEDYEKFTTILEYKRNQLSSSLFVDRIANSYSFVSLRQKVTPFLNFKKNYFHYENSLSEFKKLIDRGIERFKLFRSSIKEVLHEIRKVYNLKVKYLIYSTNKVHSAVSYLKGEFNKFQITVAKLNIHKTFGRTFTFDPTDCCIGLGHPNTLFYTTCIESSYDSLVYNYLNDAINKMQTNQFYKEIKIYKTGHSPLGVVYDILNEIFPPQKGLPFFDVLQRHLKVSSRVEKKIEEVLDTFIGHYNSIENSLNFFFRPVDEMKLTKKIAIYEEKVQIIKKVNGNQFPLVKFESSLKIDTYEDIMEQLKDQVSRKYYLTIKSIIKEGKGFMDEDEDQNIIYNGKFVLFYTAYFKRKVKRLKKMQTFLPNVKGNEDLLRVDAMILEFRNRLKTIINQKTRLLEEVDRERVRIHQILENQLRCVEYKSQMQKIEGLEIDLDRLDSILVLFEEPLIDRKPFNDLKTKLIEQSTVEEYVNEWSNLLNLSLRDIEQKALFEFSDNLSKADLSHHEEVQKILDRQELVKQLPLVFQDFVTPEYLNCNILLSEYLSKYKIDDILKLVKMSEMDFTTKNAIERIRTELAHTYYLRKGDMVTNFEDVEERLFDLLAECSAMENSLKVDKYKKHIKEIVEMIYRMIRTNTNLKEIQTITTDINRIANSKVLGSETKSFEEVKKEIMLLFETNMNKNSLGVQCFLDDEKSVESLKTKINEIQLIVKSTLRNYRQKVHGLYFVSDEDILSLLCGRIACSELLIQLYSFNEVLIEDDFVTGFSSNGERVLLVDKVNASSNMVDFFDSFAISLERTLNSYLLAKFRDVLRESPPGNKLYNDLKKFCTDNELITINNNQKISVIDDFVNDFCYFNELLYTKSHKIEFIRSLNTKWSDSVHILYPKPKIMNSKIVTQELKTNCIYPVYYPPSEIIFTELTSNIFSLITLGLAKTSGVILYGKSGTGKTETVKYYCRTILRPVYVFCCSEECDINTLENIIIGCIKMNSYLCLDEFNRLDKSTMSSVTELIFQHKEEVKFFLTMNLGYTGRNNLPSSLKSIFTEIKVDNPDVSNILKIFIPKHYDKIMEFLGYLENNCEKHEHYNFGLRAINTIRNNNLSLEDISRLFNIEVSEDTAILYSLYLYYHSTLSKKDTKLMSEAFKNIFEVEIASNLSYDSIFTYSLQASSGILIYSNVPTNLIKTIANARDVIIEYYNPPNTINFFGGYDEITGEWVDGEFVTSLKLNRDKEIWYVFDCILNSTWIENFNSVLDDNKSLCLKSGEILKIRPNQKFIFEGQCLKQLTPASLTRLFTIYVENDHSLMPIKFEPCEFDRLFRDNRVVFLVGKGKYTFISSAVKENLVVVDSLNCQSDFFPKIFNKNALIFHNHKKIFVKELVVYFERFEMASLDLQECIREYFIYGKVGDIYPKNLKLICGFDNGEVQSRLLNEANIVEIPSCDPRTYIVNCFNTSDDDKQSLHELIKDPRQVETFINLMLTKLSEGVLELADINKLCKMFKLALFLDSKENIKGEELVNIYNFISSIFHNTRLTKDETSQLGFNTTRGFCRKQELCVKDILCFILSINVPIIIVGPNMCGKRSLVEECLKDIRRDFKIYNFYEEISYDENGIYLLDSISRVPKMVLRKSLILHLEVPDYICLDYETFYSSLKGNYTSFNHKDKKDYAVYAMHKTSEKHKISCTCCFLQHQKVKRIYGNDKNDFFNIFEDKNVVFYDNLHQATISDTNILIVFESLYKYSEFIEGIEKIYKKSYEDYENRKTHIQECYKRIDEFKKQASELLKESINKKNQLRNLQIQIKSKMDNIVDIQIQMKVEKERICKNQQSLTVVLSKSIEKKKLIDIKMKNTIPLLESSKSKISTISKKHLSEIKTMVKPPEVIKRVIELVYVMLEEQPIDNPNWSFLMQYMRKDDFINKIINFSGIVNLSNIERILKGETIDLSKAYNASQACGILYEWFLANYEYKKVQIEVKPLLDETEEIEKEVRKIKCNLEEEENKYKNLENEINNSKEEFASLQMSLEDLKLEDENLQKKQNLINLTLEMIVNEKDKWHIEEPEDPLRKLKSFDWLLEENKNIFISRNQKVEDELNGRPFLKTSTTHKNFLQVLRSVQEYNTDVIIYDVDFFNPLIYKLLKYQILKQTFSIILISNVNVNFYAHCTYQIDISQKFHLDENVDLEVYEQEFIKTIVEFTDYESIIKSKTTLDNKSKHFLSLKAKREQLESLEIMRFMRS